MESELDQALQDLVSMPGGPPGSIVLIQRGKKRYLYTSGVSNITSGRPIRPHDHMRIASVSKAFSGATALALVVAEVLEMDDTIGELLPNLPVEWHPVTLYQALNHTSGLPDYTGSPIFPELIMADPTHAPPPTDLLELVADRPLVFNPGTSYQYSNSDNIVIALMVEAVTGFDYAHVLRKKVQHPLKLRQTSLPAGVELPHPYMRGYDTEASDNFEDVSEIIAFGGYAWASGGIVSPYSFRPGLHRRSIVRGKSMGPAAQFY